MKLGMTLIFLIFTIDCKIAISSNCQSNNLELIYISSPQKPYHSDVLLYLYEGNFQKKDSFIYITRFDVILHCFHYRNALVVIGAGFLIDKLGNRCELTLFFSSKIIITVCAPMQPHFCFQKKITIWYTKWKVQSYFTDSKWIFWNKAWSTCTLIKRCIKLFIDQPHVYSSIKFEHAQSKDNCNLSIDFNYSGRFPVFFPLRFGIMYICCWCFP